MAPTRVILMSCGSYNPPTNMHLRMFEIARDHLHRLGTHVVVGGVISPVHDAYAKKELASATHRCAMLRLALQNSDWVRLSTWETRQNCWTKTRLSLQHHQNLLNSMLSNSNDIKHHMQIEDIEWIPENIKNCSNNSPVQIKLLCGADLLESFGICGLWLEEDIDAIVGEHGLVVITREGSNPNKFIYDSDILSKHMHNICIVTEWIPNEVSSTRIRRALKRSESVRYLLQDSVIDYIYKNEIYDAKTTTTTIKLELSSPNVNNYLHIEPRYLSAFLTPSPSDVTMGSPSPIEVISATSIDVPDAVLCKNLQNTAAGAEAREQFINTITADNGNVKHITRAPAYPGQAKQIIVAGENGVVQIVDEVGGPLDEPTAKHRWSGPSTSGECTLEEDHRPSTVDNVAKGKIDITQTKILVSKSNTEILCEDVGTSDSREFVVKIQPGVSSFSELASIEGHTSMVGNAMKKEIIVGQKESLDSKLKTEVTDLDTNRAHEEITQIQIQSDPSSSNELILAECCWPTRGSTANNKVEFNDKEIAVRREVVDVTSGDNANIELLGNIDKVDQNVASTSKIVSEKASALVLEGFTEEKVASDRDISLKRQINDVQPGLVNNDDVVKIQPSHFSRSVITTKDDYRLKMENIKTELMEGTSKSEHLKSSKISDNGQGIDTFNPDETLKNNDKLDDKEIHSRKETVNFKPDKGKTWETEEMTVLLNITTASSDGRHECALSDFNMDEDYRFNQDSFDNDEKIEKHLYNVKSSLTDSNGDQKRDTIDDTINVTNDSKINFTESDTQITNMTIRQSYEKISKDFSKEKIDVQGKAFSEVKRDGTNDVGNGAPPKNVFKTSQEIDKESSRKIRSELESHSLERRASCDLSFEIDGKYLKSIVNSRKSPRKVKEGQFHNIEIKEPKTPQLQSEVMQNSPTETKNLGKIRKGQLTDVNVHIKNKDQIVNDQKIVRTGESTPLTLTPSKTKNFKEVEVFQIDENDREFKDQNKSIDPETSRIGKVFQKSLRMSTTGTKSPKKVKEKQLYHRGGEMKDYDRSINDRVISQLEEVFQNSSKKSSKTEEGSKKISESRIEIKDKNLPVDRFIDNRQVFRTSSPKETQNSKDLMDKAKKIIGDKAKQDLNEIKDVYTRKVRRYNIPLQGSLDSMIVSDEAFTPKPKKDDAFTKKSKSYESIKRIQEVFLGVPNKMSNSDSSQLDIPDEFCSICCYMNEITFRTEEEVSSPNQETFYTLRSTCSSIADDDDFTECDICGSLNQQQASDNLESKILVSPAHTEIPCELCRICGEVDGSYDQNTMVPANRYAFKIVETGQDNDDNFEIENCGFQSGTESVDDRSRISERESTQESDKPKSRSLFIHGSSVNKEQARELYFIPKDEIAILTSGTRKVGRKGSLFRKKEDLSTCDNRRYSSVDSLQLAKMSAKIGDKTLKVAKDSTLVRSVDNLQISRKSSRRSKSLQRSVDDIDKQDKFTDNLNSLVESLGKGENGAQMQANWTQESNMRDKEAVKMILTQHGIKIISEKETAL